MYKYMDRKEESVINVKISLLQKSKFITFNSMTLSEKHHYLTSMGQIMSLLISAMIQYAFFWILWHLSLMEIYLYCLSNGLLMDTELSSTHFKNR